MLISTIFVAHIAMVSLPNRYGAEQKTGPCGRAGGLRSANVTVLEPGATITLVWDETVNHPSHYRVSFDADGDDDFVDPATMNEYNSNAAVLIDQIADTGGSRREVQVTLPDTECENCTLQLIQVMYDKLPYTIPGNDIYYNCADLALRSGAPAADASPPIDASSDTTGGTPGAMPSTDVSSCAIGVPGRGPSIATLLLALFALPVLRRRDRPRV